MQGATMIVHTTCILAILWVDSKNEIHAQKFEKLTSVADSIIGAFYDRISVATIHIYKC